MCIRDSLKIEEEITSDNLKINENEMQTMNDSSKINDSDLSQDESQHDIQVNRNSHDNEEISSNGLENFNFNEDGTPELFNSDNKVLEEDIGKISQQDVISEDDDLEIPAFLRRQKN